MKYLSLTLALFVSACASTPSDIGLAPLGYKDRVRIEARMMMFDPYSARDVMISQPMKASMVFDGVTPVPHSGWIVCLRANAKNRLGAYTGPSLVGFVFRKGYLETTIFNNQEAVAQHCAGARFEPFDL